MFVDAQRRGVGRGARRGSPTGSCKPVDVVARVVVLGPAAQLRGRPRARRRRQPLDRAHAARDRDVGGAGRRATATRERKLGYKRARRARHGRLGRRRQAGVRPLQVRPHQPRLLHVGPLGGRRVLLRRRRQAGGADARPTSPRAQAREVSAARALDRPLRRHDAVHRRRDARARDRLRLGRRDGGGHAARLQPPRRRRRAARRDLPGGGDVRLRQPADHAPGRLGVGRGEGGGEGVRRLPRRDGHARAGRPRGLPPRRRDEAAGRPRTGRGRRRPGAAGPRAEPAGAATCWPRSGRRGAPTASRRT